MTNPQITFEHKLKLVLAYGFTLSWRKSYVNLSFPGHYMVAYWADEDFVGQPEWAVVGDNIAELVDEAFEEASLYSNFETVLADIVAGGIGLLHTDGSGAGPPIK